MKYIQMTVYTVTEGIDTITELFSSFGIDGCSIEDAKDFADFLKDDRFIWNYIDDEVMKIAQAETSITAYVDDNPQGEALTEKIQNALKRCKEADKTGALGRLAFTTEHVDDENWIDKWKEYFKVLEIGNKFVVIPAWEDMEADLDKSAYKDKLEIKLNTSVSFGTGGHATTSMCLKLLEKYVEKGADSVLDAGCGSGILSIAAVLLGAREVTAVDIDPIAVETTMDNANRNEIKDRIVAFAGDLTKGIGVKADIIAANLVAEVILFLAEDIKKHLTGKKILIASGILDEKQEQVIQKLESIGFEMIEILSENGWSALVCKIKE